MRRLRERRIVTRCQQLAALFAVAAMTTPAWTQVPNAPSPILQDMVACTSIVDDDTRLSCYDRSIQPLLAGPAEEGAAANAFSGTGDWTSEMFEMRGPWHITWQSTAVLLTLELRDAGNSFLTVAGMQVGEGSGETDIFDAGSYRINVRAINGDWQLYVIAD